MRNFHSTPGRGSKLMDVAFWWPSFSVYRDVCNSLWSLLVPRVDVKGADPSRSAIMSRLMWVGVLAGCTTRTGGVRGIISLGTASSSALQNYAQMTSYCTAAAATSASSPELWVAAFACAESNGPDQTPVKTSST